MKIDEESFIKKLKEKNTKALEFALDNYGNLAYKVVYSVLGAGFERHSIEECVNDVFMVVWNNIDSFREDKGSFKSWLIAISKYKAIDYRRKLARENNLEYLDEIITNEGNSTENIIIIEENRQEILSAINELKDIDKIIFTKRYLLEEDIEIIAKELGVNRTVIDNRLSRGRRSLKKKLTFLKEEIV
ncbi:DNA-directed RNA polymerase sigma-70 factor [Clostridium tetani]|uniref:RNA polymerase sigma factor n=1 Tax=Clostridium tetani (strain Massachusetts / E88) TaxID=212717 RepID=Q893M9_CLOTE|nr:sigma-70 family RNA polymerase sigma factor [Clostridium tetani]AAO36313.1 RNA polymerase sigma factor [Clostridium tetani E88]AVP54317.1 RNA polymerase subunit sigma-70 [Clostridium tetani]KGI37723.1 RNA polymerase sigma70 factor [Clostridium tetani]KGI39649.1 RNA polymerase sigma70 factor [Clostridium tetani ATCC 9441]KGI44194.1 RNA polymerase sigma70 factor [Clostridium tetani]